jgi:hypothetical protein
MNTPGVSCIFDPLGRAGICGDWLTGSSIEAAVLSGMSLANHVRFRYPFLYRKFYSTYLSLMRT